MLYVGKYSYKSNWLVCKNSLQMATKVTKIHNLKSQKLSEISWNQFNISIIKSKKVNQNGQISASFSQCAIFKAFSIALKAFNVLQLDSV